MNKAIEYYVEVLALYGNIPQLTEYRVFWGISEEQIEDYKRRKLLKVAA